MKSTLKSNFSVKLAPLLAGAVSLFLTAGTVLPALSQSAPTAPNSTQTRRDGDRANFEKALSLTDAQKAELKRIRDSARQQMESVFTAEQKTQMQQARQHQRPNITLSAAQKSQLQAIRQNEKDSLDAVFTPEQKQTLQQMHSQMRPQEMRSQEMRPQRAMGAPIAQ